MTLPVNRGGGDEFPTAGLMLSSQQRRDATNPEGNEPRTPLTGVLSMGSLGRQAWADLYRGGAAGVGGGSLGFLNGFLSLY